MPDRSPDLLPGTLDLLILKAAARGPMHGYGIACHLKGVSGNVLDVGESSLYPALQRLMLAGHLKGEWGLSENNRKAKYYRLTSRGRAQLRAEVSLWERYVSAVGNVLRTAKRQEAR